MQCMIWTCKRANNTASTPQCTVSNEKLHLWCRWFLVLIQINRLENQYFNCTGIFAYKWINAQSFYAEKTIFGWTWKSNVYDAQCIFYGTGTNRLARQKQQHSHTHRNLPHISRYALRSCLMHTDSSHWVTSHRERHHTTVKFNPWSHLHQMT